MPPSLFFPERKMKTNKATIALTAILSTNAPAAVTALFIDNGPGNPAGFEFTGSLSFVPNAGRDGFGTFSAGRNRIFLLSGARRQLELLGTAGTRPVSQYSSGPTNDFRWNRSLQDLSNSQISLTAPNVNQSATNFIARDGFLQTSRGYEAGDPLAWIGTTVSEDFDTVLTRLTPAWVTGSRGTQETRSFTFDTVPEPSTATLALLTTIPLLRRRRP